MLYPQTNAARTVLDLGGIWDFRLDERDPWQPIAVPASYNDQKADRRFRSHVGFAWYRTKLTVPAVLAGQRLTLRFDAVTHDAEVFLDGQPLCSHRGGFLPFEADLTARVVPGKTYELLVRVDNHISHSTLPVGNEGGIAFFGSDNPGVPAVEAGKRLQQERGVNLPNFDFFNYAGITRPVRLCATPMDCICDVTLVPHIDGVARYHVKTIGTGDVHIAILDEQGQTVATAQGAEGMLRVENPRLWKPRPGTPALYTAHITFGADVYDQPFGFRSVEVRGHQLLINGAPIHLHGPCKHEDTPFHGRGLDLCADVLDLSLYGWLNANVLRMSHYPYAEEVYALCDREGILVIDETPAVGIGAGDRLDPYKAFTLFDYHAQVLADMIARDKNHPCVILWSLGNEPDTEHFPQSAYDYWRPLYELAHRLDPQSRPVTLVCCQNDYTRDLITRTMDVVCVNRYYGWYNLSGDLETAKYALNLELDFWETIDKPLILSEYGADTISGLHGVSPEMFSEEFQAEYYEAIGECLDARDFVVGELPWVFADFSTQQGPMRAGGNRKGLFTRDRQPKLAAHVLRRRWAGK